MNKPIAGKFLLEILTKGMYSNPMHIYREYIQNSADSIDKAIATGLIDAANAEIHIDIDIDNQVIIIRDNGLGISKENVGTKLLSVGDSDKDGINERGFRGIGRLGGLAYARQVKFITSAVNEKSKTIMTCDCVRLQELLRKTNHETSDIIETITEITTILPPETEEEDKHYFEVQLIGVPSNSVLLDLNLVSEYLATTVPVDFDDQLFGSNAEKIRSHFNEKGFPIPCYNIYRGKRKVSIVKPYEKKLSTGKQNRTRQTDFVRNVQFVFAESSDGTPLYIGWLAITDFSGSISNESVQGIRLRKGNMLIGDKTTFAKFFPSEGANANKMFAGEIHILHDDLIPNSQRDDFEPSEIYSELKNKLGVWAGELNKKYRRGTSEANSALRNLEKLNKDQQELEKQILSGSITSDTKREKLAESLERINKKRTSEERKVKKALDQGTFDAERIDTIEKTLKQTEKAAKNVTQLSKEIINADYATKSDLPTSYSRDERKLYQKIINVIDDFFYNNPETASELRQAIKTELSVKKK